MKLILVLLINFVLLRGVRVIIGWDVIGRWRRWGCSSWYFVLRPAFCLALVALLR